MIKEWQKLRSNVFDIGVWSLLLQSKLPDMYCALYCTVCKGITLLYTPKQQVAVLHLSAGRHAP